MNLETLLSTEFPLQDGLIYLNHAAVAPWPKRTEDAVIAFAHENKVQGAKGYLDWLEVETSLRKKFTRLINAPSIDDIAIVKNTSEALSFVAYGLEWAEGDNIIISDQEFPSNSIVWRSLENKGVEVREVDLFSDKTPEDALIAAIDKQTKLLSISSVQYASGLKMDLQTLGEACHRKHILFCVDAIQSIGALPFDVTSVHADFVMADTHKWMLGPEGVALFYCRSEIRNRLKLHEYGWHMLNDMTNYTSNDWQITDTARRFECGSPNMLGIHAANASLSILLEIGLETIETELLKRSQHIVECLKQYEHLTLITNSDSHRLAGIVTFNNNLIDSTVLYQKLMKNNVICAPRGGGIRFSPHFYTAFDDIEAGVSMASLTD
ncbi:MAG: aminotransferase class V-fold PLP-dependent enzyme [Thioalkalispiraceae bacterium]|jgi:selenocysteine lyase/cysteine desulfurase